MELQPILHVVRLATIEPAGGIPRMAHLDEGETIG